MPRRAPATSCGFSAPNDRPEREDIDAPARPRWNLAFIENELNCSDALDMRPLEKRLGGVLSRDDRGGVHFIPLYSVALHDSSGSYPVMDEHGIRFSFLSDIDQAGSNREVGGKDRSDEEGHENERANEPSGDYVFLGH